MSLKRAKTSAGVLALLLVANLVASRFDELSAALVGILAIPLYVGLALATLAFVWMDAPSHGKGRSGRSGPNRVRQALVVFGLLVLVGMLGVVFFPPNVALAP